MRLPTYQLEHHILDTHFETFFRCSEILVGNAEIDQNGNLVSYFFMDAKKLRAWGIPSHERVSFGR